jgi:hypothetical protein
MLISIENFYIQNPHIDPDFDELFYAEAYPETKDFYQPYCDKNNISDRHRLFFHYSQYGKHSNLKKYGKALHIKPVNGLGNRLLQIDSAYAFMMEYGFDVLKICWVEGEGFSDETFEELFDITRLEHKVQIITEAKYFEASKQHIKLEEYFDQDPKTLEYIWNDINREEFFQQIINSSFCLNSFASLDWIFGLSLKYRYQFLQTYLGASKQLQEIIDSYAIDDTFIGLHIREGDAIIGPWAEHYKESKDEYYDTVIKMHDKIFLSTDSKDKQEILTKKYPNKIKCIDKDFVDIRTTIHDNKGLQAEAVVDMILLSQTSKIYGTNWSTFNEVASIVGGCPRILLTKETMSKFSFDCRREYSAITAVKNRFPILQASISSWLVQEEIKEIVIVDYYSDDFNHGFITSLDDRIKVISVKDKPYFNLSDAYNIAIQNCSYDNILKLDVDYFLNPYHKLSDWLYYDLDKTFITGNWKQNQLDNKLGFIENLNGFVVCKKEFLNKVGGYKGNQYGYGYDDSDLYERLSLECDIERVNINLMKNRVPIFHIPHSDYYRSAYYENKNIRESLLLNKKEADNDNIS